MKRKMTKIEQLEFRKAKVYCVDGSVYSGTGDCICDASEGDGQDIDGILFIDDNGEHIIFTEDEIEKIEILD